MAQLANASEGSNHNMTRRTPILAIAVIYALVAAAGAQSQPVPAMQDGRGITSYLEFGGTSNSDGQVYELNTNVGYDFSSHFGAVVGAPIYFVRPSSTSTGTTSANGIGDPYLNLHLKYPAPVINFSSGLTGTAPVADSKKGLSTGRATFDWTSHFDHGFSDLTPFAEVGIANTIMDSRLYVRPYTTLGFNTHFQIGANYDVWKFVSVGASGYDIVPKGQQTVFSRVNPAAAAGNPGSVHSGRIFENSQQTTGSASIAQDHGFSAWVDANPSKTVDLELGFTRSMVYDLNSVAFSIGVNLGKLYRGSQK
jgi:hypothetical protein